MATDTPLLTRVRLMAAKVETTTGTQISLGTNDASFNCFDLKYTADIPPTERPGQASLSNLPPIPGAQMAKVSFKTEVYNAAATPAWLTTLLIGCGWGVTTGVYSPSSGASTTLTIGVYQQGSRLRYLAGSQGTFKINGEYGKPAHIDWEFTGKWGGTASTAILAPTFPSTTPPRFAGCTMTIGGASYRMSKMEFDAGNTVTMRADASDTSLNTGYHSAFVTQRKITVKVDPEAVPYATTNWPAIHLNSTSSAFSCAIGSGANGIITIAAPALQLLDPPNDGDRSGLLTDDLTFLATPSPFGSADTEATIVPS